MFVSLCCSPLVQGVVTECVCVWRRQRCVHLVETCRGVPRCADTWHRALAQTQTHTRSECVCVCVFEENRECVSGVIVWCVCQHVVSVSTLEMHMFICIEDSSFFIPFKLMCFCMCSKVYELKSLLFFIFFGSKVPKTSYSLKTILPISPALCGDMKGTVQGSCCISPLLFCLPFLFLTGSLPV